MSETEDMKLIEEGGEVPADKSRGLPLGEVLDFMRLLWAVDHGLQSTSKRMEATIGLTGPQRLVLRLVGRFPGIAAGKLAQILHVHPSTLTGVLKRLEKRGLIERRSDPLDGRRALFALTDAGRAMDVPATGTVEAAVQRVLSRMSRTRIIGAQDVLTALAEELGGTASALMEASAANRSELVPLASKEALPEEGQPGGDSTPGSTGRSAVR